MKKTEAASWAAVFALCGVIIWMSQTPAPYRHVDVVRAERVGDEIQFVATFEKTACNFVRLTVVTGFLGKTDFVPYRNLDDIDVGDRDLGQQTLRLAFEPGEADWIEIRTRHDCNGEKVDKVFHRIEPV